MVPSTDRIASKPGLCLHFEVIKSGSYCEFTTIVWTERVVAWRGLLRTQSLRPRSTAASWCGRTPSFLIQVEFIRSLSPWAWLMRLSGRFEQVGFNLQPISFRVLILLIVRLTWAVWWKMPQNEPYETVFDQGEWNRYPYSGEMSMM